MTSAASARDAPFTLAHARAATSLIRGRRGRAIARNGVRKGQGARRRDRAAATSPRPFGDRRARDASPAPARRSPADGVPRRAARRAPRSERVATLGGERALAATCRECRPARDRPRWRGCGGADRDAFAARRRRCAARRASTLGDGARATITGSSARSRAARTSRRAAPAREPAPRRARGRVARGRARPRAVSNGARARRARAHVAPSAAPSPAQRAHRRARRCARRARRGALAARSRRPRRRALSERLAGARSSRCALAALGPSRGAPTSGARPRRGARGRARAARGGATQRPGGGRGVGASCRRARPRNSTRAASSRGADRRLGASSAPRRGGVRHHAATRGRAPPGASRERVDAEPAASRTRAAGVEREPPCAAPRERRSAEGRAIARRAPRPSR